MIHLPTLRFDNPVAVRELRMRMRGGRAHLVMFAYVLVLSLVVFLGYLLSFNSSGPGGVQRMSPNLGKDLFTAMFGFQVALIGLVTPGLTAWLISAEHEQQTVELLLSSLLTSRNIVAGKLLPAIMFLLLLLLSSLPLATFCLVFGGLTPLKVLSGYVGLAFYGYVLACAGILSSSLFKKSFAATIVAYMFAGAYTFIALTAFGSFYVSSRYAGGSLGHAGGVWGGLGIFPSFFVGFLEDRELYAQIFGINVPIALVMAIASFLLGLLLVTMATANIPHFREDRAPKVRLVFTAYSAFVVAVLVGSFAGTSSATTAVSREAVAVIMGALVAAAVTAAPQVAAAPLRDRDGSLASRLMHALLHPRQWLRTDGAGGFWFVLAWSGLMAFILYFGLTLAGANMTPVTEEMAWLFLVAIAMTAASGAFGLMLYALTGQVVMARALGFLVTAVFWAVSSAIYTAIGSVYGEGLAVSAGGWIRYVWPFSPFNEWAHSSPPSSVRVFMSAVFSVGYAVAT
ncbi:MAG: ABC transporter permease subunit, partial [Armatimonadota bacterium]